MRTEVIFHHGWGFDSTMWDAWVSALSNINTTCFTAERGYFGLAKKAPTFSPSASYKIVVTHSLGLHFVSDQELKQCDALLVLSGFLHFHPSEQLSRKRSQRVIRAMKEKLPRDPAALMNDFWTNCYAPEFGPAAFVPVETMHLNLLLDDLDILDKHEVSADKLAVVPHVVWVTSADDRILHPTTAEQVSEIPTQTTCISITGGSHAFALTGICDATQLFSYCQTKDLREPCHQ